MRIACALLLAMLPSLGAADVSVVDIWEALPGKNARMFQAALEVKVIHEKLGAKIWVAGDQLGRLHYVSTFPSWADWAKFGAAAAQSKELTDWWDKVSQDPAAKHIEEYMVEEVTPPRN
jgi:glutathione S-transferase